MKSALAALALLLVLVGCVPDDGVVEVRVPAPEDAERRWYRRYGWIAPGRSSG